MCVRAHTHTYIYIYIYIYTHTHAHTHAHIYVCVYIYIYHLILSWTIVCLAAGNCNCTSSPRPTVYTHKVCILCMVQPPNIKLKFRSQKDTWYQCVYIYIYIYIYISIVGCHKKFEQSKKLNWNTDLIISWLVFTKRWSLSAVEQFSDFHYLYLIY